MMRTVFPKLSGRIAWLRSYDCAMTRRDVFKNRREDTFL